MDFTKFSICTERLMIRSFTQVDSNDIYLIRTEENFNKYTNDEPWISIKDAKDFLDFALCLYTDDITRKWFRLFFAICNKHTNELIGYCGFGNNEYMSKSVEVFYGISKKHQNNGYALEACNMSIQIAYNLMKIKEFIGFVHRDNKPSIRVLEKSGFQYKGIINNAPEEYRKYNGQLLYIKLI